jgi:hypothetical protein
MRTLDRLDPVPVVEAELSRVQRRVVEDQNIGPRHLLEKP